MATAWEVIGYLQSSRYRREILGALLEAKTPSSLEKLLDLKISHVSRALKELEKKHLIKCHTPGLRKGRMYQATAYGKEVVKKIK